MNILVLGKGAREHALSWKLSLSPLVDKVFVMPGNPGITLIDDIPCINEDPTDFDTLEKICKQRSISMAVIGPEKYLELGMADFLSKNGIATIGPSREGAKLESSKFHSKTLMKESSIATAEFDFFTNYEAALAFIKTWPFKNGLVIKADGLASGKGVFVCDTIEQAQNDLRLLCLENPLGLENPTHVLIEEKLIGKELSAFAISDGVDHLYIGDACDYKKQGDGNTGHNTGGMGCYSPADWITNDERQYIQRQILDKLFSSLKQRNIQFQGILFAGIMRCENGDLKVLEFNTRFGDPEAQVIIPRIDGDLAKIFHACAHKKLTLIKDQFHLSNESTCHVVKASGGYPGIETPLNLHNEIKINPDFFNVKSRKLFFSGVSRKDNILINTGGRVLGITATASNRTEAIAKAYEALEFVSFDGEYFRTDIGS